MCVQFGVQLDAPGGDVAEGGRGPGRGRRQQQNCPGPGHAEQEQAVQGHPQGQDGEAHDVTRGAPHRTPHHRNGQTR